MYRALFALLFVTLTPFLLSAQTVGLRVGTGSTNIRSGAALDAITDQAESAGVMSYGIYAELPLTDIISLRPGLELNRRGTAVSLTDDVALFGVDLPLGARAKTRFRYVDVPLLVQVNSPKTTGLRPYAFAGPSIGYAVGGRVTTSAKAIIELDLFSTPINLDAIGYQRLHVAAVGGAGVKADVFGAELFVEARYEHGLTQPYDVPLVQDKVGFRNFNVGAGIAFPLR